MRGINSITAIDTPRSHDPDRWRVLLQMADLNRGGVGTQQQIFLQVKGVLHVPSRVVFGNVQWRGRWLEVMGCGMVDPAVLEGLGLDPERYSGFAAGLGVERFCMVRHGIDDIRRLYTSDLRFLEQF